MDCNAPLSNQRCARHRPGHVGDQRAGWSAESLAGASLEELVQRALFEFGPLGYVSTNLVDLPVIEMLGAVGGDATDVEPSTDAGGGLAQRVEHPDHHDHAVVDAALAHLEVREQGARLLGHWRAGADRMEADVLVVAHHPVWIDLDDPRAVVGVSGGEQPCRWGPVALFTGDILNEVLILITQHRQDALLQSVADVFGFENDCRRLAEHPLEVAQDRPRPAATPGGTVAEGMQLPRWIAHAAPRVGDLCVGGDHQAVGADNRKDNSHGATPAWDEGLVMCTPTGPACMRSSQLRCVVSWQAPAGWFAGDVGDCG